MPFMPIAKLLAKIEKDPIEGGRVAQERHEGVRKASYESSVSAGALYRALKGKPDLIHAFYELSMWQSDEGKKAYNKNPKYLNKHCHQFVYGAREGSEGKRAEDHASATQSCYDDRSKSLDQILEALTNGGFDGLKNARSARQVRPKVKSLAISKATKEDQRIEEATTTGSRTAAANPQQQANSTPQTLADLVKAALPIAMCPEDLQGLDELGEDEHATIVVKKMKDSQSEYIRFEAVEITP